MDAEILALAGVVLGGLVTLTASLTSDVLRFRRVESRRWREDQLAACVNYVRLTRLVGRKAREIQESERPDKETSTRGELVVAEEERALATEQLGMLMGLKTVDCAVAVNEALWPMEVASRRGEWVETGRWNRLDATWREAVRDFQIAARFELGLSPDVPEVSDLPQRRFRAKLRNPDDRCSNPGYM